MSELLLLSIEASSNVCSVALLQYDFSYKDHKKHEPIWMDQISFSGPQTHAAKLLPSISSLLEKKTGLSKANINGVVFGRGPGGFTSVRVACGVAQGLALGLNIPLLAVNSLYALAWQYRKSNVNCIVSLIDARMGEVFMGIYTPNHDNPNSPNILLSPCLIAINEVLAWLQNMVNDKSMQLILCGNALVEYAEHFVNLPLGFELGDHNLSDALTLAEIGYTKWGSADFADPALAMPLYVRDKVAFTTVEREQGQGGNPKAQTPMFPVFSAQGQKVELVANIFSQTMTQEQHHLAGLGMSFSVMTLQHLEQVFCIEKAVATQPWSKGNFVDALAAGYGAWVIVQNHSDGASEVLAYALQLYLPDLSELLLLGVSAQHQRKGLGRAILEYTHYQSSARSLTQQMLEVRPSNAAALALYAQAGYVKIGERRGYYKGLDGEREDAWLLQKKWD